MRMSKELRKIVEKATIFEVKHFLFSVLNVNYMHETLPYQ